MVRATKKIVETKPKLSSVPEFSKVGKKWSTEEDEQLKSETQYGLLNSEIAKLHCRTEKGIEFRKLHIARGLYVIDGMTVEDASKEMKIELVDLQLYLSQLEEKEILRNVRKQQKVKTIETKPYFPTPYELITQKINDENNENCECKCPKYEKCKCC